MNTQKVHLNPAEKELGRGIFGGLIAVGLIIFLLNILFIRELVRSDGQRFSKMAPSSRFYPNVTFLRIMAIIQSVFLILGAVGYVAVGSVGVNVVNQ